MTANAVRLPAVGEALHQGWELCAEGRDRQAVDVPAPWQRVWPGFEGVGDYRLRFRRDDAPVFLRFEGVATEATVFCNDIEVGRHLGTWTPFVIDVTPTLRDGANELVVRVDQKPEHVTAGFLPWIDSAFGGLWAPVTRVTEPTLPDRAAVDAGLRIDGTRLLRHGKPFHLRAVLHWGDYRELGAPLPSRATIEREVEWLTSLGFNAVKMCLWVPPEDYLEVCDERGLLVWQEYPIWARAVRDDGVLGELEEMVRRDRAHRCVGIRTLTCENQHLDPDVALRMVGLVRELAPGGLVLDNSAFVGMEQCGDFWDEHPYLHHRAWRRYPARMRAALARRAVKPLLLGETMSFDTWRGAAPDGDPGLPERARRAALAGRKDQIELLRRELPDVGYAINVMRDTIKTPLGLCDVEGQPKFGADEWSWHGDAMLMLDLPQRGFSEAIALELWGSHYGDGALTGALLVGGDVWMPDRDVTLAPGETRALGTIAVDVPATDRPRPLTVRARLGEVGNTWRLWALPALPPTDDPRLRLAGPYAGSWRWPYHMFLSPILWAEPGLIDAGVVSELLLSDLVTGRTLAPDPSLRPLLEVWNVHDQGDRTPKLPLVGVTRASGEVQVWSALRDDTPAGRWLHREVLARLEDYAPPDVEIVPPSDSIVPQRWTMTADGRVPCLVEVGEGVDLEGFAHFEADVDVPAAWADTELTMQAEAVGDGFRLTIDDQPIGEAGNLRAAWDVCRFTPQEFSVRLAPGRHRLALEVREWLGAGAMLGPVVLTRTPQSLWY